METYEILLTKTETKTVYLPANSVHEALDRVKLSDPDFNLDYISSDKLDADGDPQTWEIVAACESCGATILTGERHFDWSDCDTCENCGGASPDHRTSIVM